MPSIFQALDHKTGKPLETTISAPSRSFSQFCSSFSPAKLRTRLLHIISFPRTEAALGHLVTPGTVKSPFVQYFGCSCTLNPEQQNLNPKPKPYVFSLSCAFAFCARRTSPSGMGRPLACAARPRVFVCYKHCTSMYIYICIYIYTYMLPVYKASGWL